MTTKPIFLFVFIIGGLLAVAGVTILKMESEHHTLLDTCIQQQKQIEYLKAENRMINKFATEANNRSPLQEEK